MKLTFIKITKMIIFTIMLIFLPSTIFSTDLQFEWGKFTLNAQSWQNISLKNSYVSPIIIVSPQYTSTSQNRGIGLWLNNVQEKSFEIYASNHQYDSTNTITVNYIAFEEGNWTFPGTNKIVEAGKTSTNKVGYAGTGNWECPVHGNKIYFSNSFSSNPLVFSTRATANNNAWGVTFQNNLNDETQTVGTNGMCIGLSQANAPSPNSLLDYETIFWIAMDEVHHNITTVEYEAMWQNRDSGTSGGNWINGYADSRPFAQNWATSFSSPLHGAIVSQTTNIGGEGGWPVLYDYSTSAIRMFIDENIDRSHTKSESGGGFGFTDEIAYGNLPPSSTNLTITPTFTWQNNNIHITTDVADPQTIFTIKNVTGTILYPDSTKKNVSFNNSAPVSKKTSSPDLETASKSLSVPPDESIWLNNWNYRKKFTITGSNVSDVENYTLRINVYNKEGTDIGNNIYTGGKAKTDYSDIRFTNANANASGILPYWKEREGADFAIFWIKFDHIPQSPGNATFYVYYNNSAASYQGNGSNTFLYFEDFENYGAEPDDVIPSKWTNYNSGTVLLDTELNGNRVLKKTANNDPSGGKTSLGVNFSNYELLWKTNRINQLAGAINRYAISDENANGYSTYSSSFGPNMKYKLEKRNSGSPSGLPGGEKTFATQWNTWYYMKLNRYEGNFDFIFMDLTETVFETFETYDISWNNFNTLYIHGGQEYWSDDFLLRKYILAEPYISSWETEKKWKNAKEGETNYITYSYVENSNIQELTSIKTNININSYSSDGSDQNSNTYPMLEVEFSKGDNLDWVKIGTIIPSGTGGYSLTTTNPDILKNWKFKENRNIRIRGINMDNYDISNTDIIGWNTLNVSLDSNEISRQWFLNFNDTNQTGFYNVTNIITCDKGNLCNNKIYTNKSFEITDKGNITLHAPYNNQKFLGTNSINFTWDVVSSFTNNTCYLFIDSILKKTVNCTSGINVSEIVTITGQGIHTWKVESKDGFNTTSFSDIYNFYLINNKSLEGEKSIQSINKNMYLIQTVFKRENSNHSYSYLDKTHIGFIGGSWSIMYDLLQIVDSGLGKLYRWDFTNTNQNLSYSYTHNPEDYKISELFILGLE